MNSETTNKEASERTLASFNALSLAHEVLEENPLLATKIETALVSSELDAETAMQEVIRFLFLVAKIKAGRLTPSQRVDIAWHEFILFTQTYHRFCEECFGRFIHHHPGGSSELNRKQFQDTLRVYEQYFGTPNPAYWPGKRCDAECGACESI